MDKYEVIIYWSDEDGVFVAEAPELAGCITHGATRQAAAENIAEAIDLWVETAIEFGNPVPVPKSRRPVPA
ncbi:MAG: type II toxin-antitoxin system HicB family antitoxin [Chloroflexota bacterium]|nr:type II toxin-antitoxin system HicB family antitoxin [Chloroflexota bacterium]